MKKLSEFDKEPRLKTFQQQLKDMPTLTQGQCCNLKMEKNNTRVWLCRVGNGITVERYVGGRWVRAAGGCMESEAPALFELRMLGVI